MQVSKQTSKRSHVWHGIYWRERGGRLNSRQVRAAANKQTNACAYMFAHRGDVRKKFRKINKVVVSSDGNDN